MKNFNLCLLGFGNVGCALLDLLFEKRGELWEEFGVNWRVTGVASRSLGWLVAPEGFSDEELVYAPLAGLAQKLSPAPPDVESWLAAARCDVLFELTSLEPLTGEPAVSHVRAGLEHGAHVVTANKGTVVHAHRQLSELARARGRRFLFEASVAEFPAFSLFRGSLPAARLLSFEGLLNSTTTVILDEIASGRTFEEGVRRAQELGIAETDPTHDVEGWDAAVKACALANVLMGAGLKIEEVGREGIRGLKDEDVRAAHAEGRPYRLVARARLDEAGRVSADVRPERVSPRGPFASVEGTTLAIHYELDVLPGLTVIAHDPDLTSTAYGLLADFIEATRGEG
ncbi:MAG: homoserine dehydrogenase [Acidobacteria bacterium]|nr:homoserine dehydrogenase [Acidobacteriota bacterium]